MRTPGRIAAFLGCLLLVFVATFGLGRLIGPGTTTAASSPSHGGGETGHEDETGEKTGQETGHEAGHGSPEPTSKESETPGGLMIARDGYRLALTRARLAPSGETPISFRILGPDGHAVTAYTPAHGKELHLIAVRRDLTGFQHVHPERAADGTWSTTIDTATPGSYRLFADFVPAARGAGLTLGADVAVAGPYRPAALPADSRVDRVGDYAITLAGDLVPGAQAELTATVTTTAGQPITDLDPYLEAYGHLVALRDGDLAYLHVHPDGAPGDGRTAAGPAVTFFAAVPSEGRYRLFLDFSHRGVVRTAEFTVSTPGHGHG